MNESDIDTQFRPRDEIAAQKLNYENKKVNGKENEVKRSEKALHNMDKNITIIEKDVSSGDSDISESKSREITIADIFKGILSEEESPADINESKTKKSPPNTLIEDISPITSINSPPRIIRNNDIEELDKEKNQNVNKSLPDPPPSVDISLASIRKNLCDAFDSVASDSDEDEYNNVNNNDDSVSDNDMENNNATKKKTSRKLYFDSTSYLNNTVKTLNDESKSRVDGGDDSTAITTSDVSVMDIANLPLAKTKSPRKRFSPLRFWEVEHIFYSINGIEKTSYGVKQPEIKKRKIERKSQIRKENGKYEKCEYPSDVEEDDQDYFEDSTGERIRFTSNRKKRKVSAGITMRNMIKKKNQYASGILTIRPKHVKYKDLSKKGDLLMCAVSCQENSLILSIGNKNYLLYELQSVRIPIDVEYGIENRSEKQTAIINFTFIYS